MTVWLVIVGVGIGTFLFRATMFVLLDDRNLPAWTDRPLALVGPAAIGALVGGMVLTSEGRPGVAGLPELCSVVAAFATVRVCGDVSRGLFAGFAVLWALTWLGP